MMLTVYCECDQLREKRRYGAFSTCYLVAGHFAERVTHYSS